MAFLSPWELFWHQYLPNHSLSLPGDLVGTCVTWWRVDVTVMLRLEPMEMIAAVSLGMNVANFLLLHHNSPHIFKGVFEAPSSVGTCAVFLKGKWNNTSFVTSPISRCCYFSLSFSPSAVCTSVLIGFWVGRAILTLRLFYSSSLCSDCWTGFAGNSNTSCTRLQLGGKVNFILNIF